MSECLRQSGPLPDQDRLVLHGHGRSAVGGPAARGPVCLGPGLVLPQFLLMGRRLRGQPLLRAGHDAFGGFDLDPYLVGGRQGPLIEPVPGRAGPDKQITQT